jgi:hypothetical protein
MNPFRKTYEGGNKPLTGNDFKLLYGNRDKADRVICRAQEDYKDGLCYDESPDNPDNPNNPTCPLETGSNFLYKITVGEYVSLASNEHYGYSDGEHSYNGTSFGSVEILNVPDSSIILHNNCSKFEMEQQLEFADNYFNAAETSWYKLYSTVNEIYKDGVLVDYPNNPLFVKSDVGKTFCISVNASITCLGYSTYHIIPEDFYGDIGFIFGTIGSAELMDGLDLHINKFVTSSVSSAYETNFEMKSNYECSEAAEEFWYEYRAWGSDDSFVRVDGSILTSSSGKSSDQTFKNATQELEVRIHFSNCSKNCINLTYDEET